MKGDTETPRARTPAARNRDLLFNCILLAGWFYSERLLSLTDPTDSPDRGF